MDKTKEMTQEREAAILEGAINKWGNTLQIAVAIEELAELQKALCKYLRYPGKTSRGHIPPYFDEPLVPFDDAVIREEMADVSIMLNQLELIFGDCTEEEIAKLERLEKLVGIVPQPDAPTCRWTPEDIEIAKTLRVINPFLDTIHRRPNGELEAIERWPLIVRDPRFSSPVPIRKSLFGNLELGQFVLLADIIGGGGKGGNGE